MFGLGKVSNGYVLTDYTDPEVPEKGVVFMHRGDSTQTALAVLLYIKALLDDGCVSTEDIEITVKPYTKKDSKNVKVRGSDKINKKVDGVRGGVREAYGSGSGSGGKGKCCGKDCGSKQG